MKPSTIILLLILILIIAFLAFFFTGGTLKAQVNINSANASSQQKAFAAAKSVIENASAPQVFTAKDWSDASSYTLIDAEILLTNRGLWTAEWLNIELEPTDGDIAVYSLTGTGTDVAPRNFSRINLKLLTQASSEAKRTVRIQYYVYGISRTIKLEI